jgi:putative SOS response-associated peptidase YedK
MCGRFTLTKKKEVKNTYNIDIKPNFNVTPASHVLVLTRDLLSDSISPNLVKWEYSPSWAKKPMHIFNARSETMHEKPSFKEAMRCVFIVDGWYEWLREDNKKIPYYHSLGNNIFHLGGVYNKNGCAIVTQESIGQLRKVHHRQPILLDGNEIEPWLSGNNIFSSKITNDISLYEVSTYMNSTKNNDEKCIQRI